MARKILFPTDGSETAKAAGRVAADIAKGEGDSVLVLAVVQGADIAALEYEAAGPGMYGTVEAGMYDAVNVATYEAVAAARSEYLRKEAEAEVEALAATGVTATAEVVTADSEYKAIVSKAQEIGADFIVMGTHGHTGITRAIIGSVADRVLRHSPVPVVLVPLAEKRESTS